MTKIYTKEINACDECNHSIWLIPQCMHPLYKSPYGVMRENDKGISKYCPLPDKEAIKETFICPECNEEKPISTRCSKGYCRSCSGNDF